MPISTRIRELREARGWSQRELARRARTRQATIHALEAGDRRQIFELLDRIAAALECAPGDLLERTPRRRKR